LIAFFGKAKEVKIDAVAVNKNPTRRRLAETFAFSVKEFEGVSLRRSTS